MPKAKASLLSHCCGLNRQESEEPRPPVRDNNTLDARFTQAGSSGQSVVLRTVPPSRTGHSANAFRYSPTKFEFAPSGDARTDFIAGAEALLGGPWRNWVGSGDSRDVVRVQNMLYKAYSDCVDPPASTLSLDQAEAALADAAARLAARPDILPTLQYVGGPFQAQRIPELLAHEASAIVMHRLSDTTEQRNRPHWGRISIRIDPQKYAEAVEVMAKIAEKYPDDVSHTKMMPPRFDRTDDGVIYLYSDRKAAEIVNMLRKAGVLRTGDPAKDIPFTTRIAPGAFMARLPPGAMAFDADAMAVTPFAVRGTQGSLGAYGSAVIGAAAAYSVATGRSVADSVDFVLDCLEQDAWPDDVARLTNPWFTPTP